jgi:hypothetical protein
VVVVYLLRPLLCFLTILGSATSDDLSPHLDDVLQIMALSRSDLAIAKDYLPDPDRMSVTQRLMSAPLATEPWLEGIARDLRSGDDSAGIGVASRLLGGDLTAVSQSDTFRADGDLVTFLLQAGPMVRDSPAVSFPHLLDLVRPDTTLTSPTQDALLEFGRSIPTLRLLSIAAGILRHDTICSLLRGEDHPKMEPSHFDTPWGRVSIGSEQDDVYRESHLLIIDPGGDDVYVGVAGVSSDVLPVSVAIDWRGNDRYEKSAATGLFGLGVLIDFSGDDLYEGENGTQASGVGGVGLLIDREGNDTYIATIGAQGFGLFGVGVLIDDQGDDHYFCDMLGQGAAGPSGVGLILDRVGDDTYRAGGPFRDFRESGAYAQSMSQGFSCGLQTEASGGAGILVDLMGADRYETEYFGQGTAFWGGLGALYDQKGNDVYTARRYAQGCGLHLSMGILVDHSGNDVYSIWGVGQGVGHDLAVGVLTDNDGDDRFDATWMAQGAGNGNGTGMLIDRAGDDVYRAEREDTQGYGTGSRGFGSIGVLLDLKGEDRFRSSGQRRIVVSGEIGVRYDVADGAGP